MAYAPIFCVKCRDNLFDDLFNTSIHEALKSFLQCKYNIKAHIVPISAADCRARQSAAFSRPVLITRLCPALAHPPKFKGTGV